MLIITAYVNPEPKSIAIGSVSYLANFMTSSLFGSHNILV